MELVRVVNEVVKNEWRGRRTEREHSMNNNGNNNYNNVFGNNSLTQINGCSNNNIFGNNSMGPVVSAGISISKNGKNNCVPISQITEHTSSLYLIDVSSFKVEIRFLLGKRDMRGVFSYAGHEYKLSITDLHFEQRFLDKPVGDYEIDRTLLTISLGENYFDTFYKLIAGIIPIEYGKKWSNQ